MMSSLDLGSVNSWSLQHRWWLIFSFNPFIHLGVRNPVDCPALSPRFGDMGSQLPLCLFLAAHLYLGLITRGCGNLIFILKGETLMSCPIYKVIMLRKNQQLN